MPAEHPPTLYVVSDSRGQTSAAVLQAALVQFQGQRYTVVREANVRTVEQVEAIVDAVPIVMQCPAERDMHDSTSTMSEIFISPVLSISVNFHTWVPEPMSSPRNFPLSIGPPDTPIVGRSHEAAPISSAGVVLSQPIISTTPSNGLARIDSSTSIAAWLR